MAAAALAKLGRRLIVRFGTRDEMPWTVSYTQACLKAMGQRHGEHYARAVRNEMVASGLLVPVGYHIPLKPNTKPDRDGFVFHARYLIYRTRKIFSPGKPTSDSLCPQSDPCQALLDAWAKLLGVPLNTEEPP